MEVDQSTPRWSTGCDAIINITPPVLQAGDEQKIIHNETSIQQTYENQSSDADSIVFKGLERMFKTTLETGDIGIFSINAPQLSPPSATSRRMLSAFGGSSCYKLSRCPLTYEVPRLDSRWFPQSYVRDTVSEIITIHESSGRTFDDADCRSFSMTQASDSAYELSNHRSCISHRSQPEIKVSFQRPLSPFAYPTRLKRPGFRPSSPALTDGGAIDYSRRIEIERPQYETPHIIASSSSLYGEKRRPPSKLRTHGTVPSFPLTRQYFPPHFSSSQSITHRNPGGLRNEGSRRKLSPASSNTAPVPNSFNPDSIVNSQAIVHIQPKGTCEKHYLGSPQFYDYTEDFEESEELKAELEYPELKNYVNSSSIDSLNYEYDSPKQAGESNSSFHKSLVNIALPKNSLDSQFANMRATKEQFFQTIKGDTSIDLHPNSLINDENVDLSTLNASSVQHGVRELADHVEEKFETQSLPFELSIDPDKSDINRSFTTIDQIEMDLTGVLVSLDSQNKYVNQVEEIPSFVETNDVTARLETPETKENFDILSMKSNKTHKTAEERHETLGKVRGNPELANIEYFRPISPSISVSRTDPRSISFASPDTSSKNIGEFITSESERGGKKNDSDIQAVAEIRPPSRILIGSPLISDSPPVLQLSPNHKTPHRNFYEPLGDKNSEEPHQERSGNRRYHRLNIVGSPPDFSHDPINMSNISRPNSSCLLSRFSSPILAPQPISPARQLRLKHSVPHLMKALPPLPLPQSFSPQLADSGMNSFGETEDFKLLSPEIPFLSNQFRPTSKLDTEARKTCNLQAHHQNELAIKFAPQMKPFENNSRSPSNSRHGNLEPRTRVGSKVIPSFMTIPKESKTLKLQKPKLRAVNRAANPHQNTVRAKNLSTGTIFKSCLHSRKPKDLFVSHKKINGVFGQANENLNSRGPGIVYVSNFDTEVRQKLETPSMTTNSLKTFPALSGPTGILEGHSEFSDDNSHIQRYGSFKKKILDLKSRMTPPFATRFGVPPYNDANWNQTNASEFHHTRTRKPALSSDLKRDKSKPIRRLTENLQGQRLRAKVRALIRGAKSVIGTSVKSRVSLKNM